MEGNPSGRPKWKTLQPRAFRGRTAFGSIAVRRRGRSASRFPSTRFASPGRTVREKVEDVSNTQASI